MRAAAKQERRQQLNQEKTIRREREETAKLRSYAYVIWYRFHVCIDDNGVSCSAFMKPEKMTNKIEKYGSSADDRYVM